MITDSLHFTLLPTLKSILIHQGETNRIEASLSTPDLLQEDEKKKLEVMKKMTSNFQKLM